MDFGTFMIVTWVISYCISILVFMYRAGSGILMWGVPSGYRLKYFVMNLHWLAITIGKALVWPIVLVLWFAQNRPESPWTVVGKKYGVPLVRHKAKIAQVVNEVEKTQW